jgi:hypothetical protein
VEAETFFSIEWMRQIEPYLADRRKPADADAGAVLKLE